MSRSALLALAMAGMAATAGVEPASAQPSTFYWNGGCPYIAGWIPGDGVIGPGGMGWKVEPTFYVRVRYYYLGNFCS